MITVGMSNWGLREQERSSQFESSSESPRNRVRTVSQRDKKDHPKPWFAVKTAPRNAVDHRSLFARRKQLSREQRVGPAQVPIQEQEKGTKESFRNH